MASPAKPGVHGSGMSGGKVTTPQKTGTPSRKAQLEKMPHDELVQYTMKHMLFLQKLKAKCDDIQNKSGKEIGELKAALDLEKEKSIQLIEEKQQVERQLLDANKKINSTDEELDCVKMKQETLLISMKSFQQDYDILKKELQDSNMQVSSLQEALETKDKSLKENSDKELKAEEIKQHNKSLSSELSALKIAISSIKEQHKHDIGKHEKEVEQLKSSFNELFEEGNIKNKELSNCKKELEQVIEVNKEFDDNLNKTKLDAESLLKSKNEAIASLEAKLEDISNQNIKLEKQNQVNVSDAIEVQAYKDKLSEMEKLAEELQLSNSEQELAVQKYANENLKYSQDLVKINEKYRESENSFREIKEELQHTIDLANSEKAILEAKCFEMQSSLLSTEEKLHTNSKELVELRTNTTNNNAIEKLETELLNLKEEVELKNKVFESQKNQFLNQIEAIELEKSNIFKELSDFVSLVQPETNSATGNDNDPYLLPLAKQYITIINEELLSRQSTISECKQTNEDLTTKITELESLIENTQQDSNNEATLVENLKTQTEKNSELSLKYNELAAELELKSKKVEETEKQIKEILSELKNTEIIRDENVNLKETIKQLNRNAEKSKEQFSSEMKNIEEERNQLVIKLESTVAETSLLKEKIPVLEKNLQTEALSKNEVNLQLEELTRSYSEAKKTILKYEEEVGLKDASISNLQDNLKEMEGKLTEGCDFKKEIDDMKLKISTSNHEITNLTIENQKLSELNETTSEELHSMKQKHNEVSEQFQAHKNEVDDQITANKTVIEDLEIKVKNEEEKSLSIVQNHHEISEANIKFQQEITELKSQNLQLQNRIECLLTTINEKENLIAEITEGKENHNSKILESKNTEIETLETKLSELSSEIQNEITERQLVVNSCEALKENLLQQNLQLEQSKRDIESLKATHDLVQEEKHKLGQDNEEVVKCNQELNAEYKRMKHDKESAEEEIINLKQAMIEIEATTAEDKRNFVEAIDSHKAKQEKLCKEIGEKENSIENLKSELKDFGDKYKTEMNQFELTKKEWATERENFNIRLETLKENCESYEKQIHHISETKIETETLQKSSNSEEIEKVKKSLKNAEDYSNKLKVVAVKTKKELEATKKQVASLQDEKTNLQSKLENLSLQLQSSNTQASNVQMMQRECDNLQDNLDKIIEEKKSIEKSYEEVVNQLKSSQSVKDELQSHLNVSQSKVEALNVEKQDLQDLNTVTKSTVEMLETTRNQLVKERENLKKEIEGSKESICEIQGDLKLEKQRHEETRQELSLVKKGVKQQDVMTLEMVQYEKTVSDLTMQYEEMEEKLKQMEREKKELNEQLSLSLEGKNKIEQQQIEREGELMKMTDALTIRNREFDEIKIVKDGLKQNLAEATEAMEIAQRQNEEYKLTEAKLMSDCRLYQDNIERIKSANERSIEMMERKLQSLQDECMLLKNEKSSLSEDYESYKVRVHSVLKQQKDRDVREKQSGIEAGELQQCRSTLDKVKLKLHEAQNNLHARNSELELVQADLNRLSQQHSNESERAGEREVRWKNRVKELQSELQIIRKQHADLMARVDENMSTLQSNHDEEVHNLKLSHDHYTEKLNEQIQRKDEEILQLKTEQKQKKKVESKKVSSTPVKSTNRVVTPSYKPQKSEDTSSHFRSHSQHLDFRSLTREEGEGQENPEPLSPAASFEQILNTSEIRSISMVSDTKSVKSDAQQQMGIEAEFETQRKKLEHLSEVLRESEATVAQFVDQNKVLKEEIRRLEKNQERETSVSNMEYLKNILYKFVTLPPSDERKRLLPVLDTLLKFNPEEKSKLFELAEGDTGSAESQGSWSGYFQRWSGLQ